MKEISMLLVGFDIFLPYKKVQGLLSFEPRREKTNILVSDLVPHKPGCTVTEDGQRLEISDLESRGIILSK